MYSYELTKLDSKKLVEIFATKKERRMGFFDNLNCHVL